MIDPHCCGQQPVTARFDQGSIQPAWRTQQRIEQVADRGQQQRRRHDRDARHIGQPAGHDHRADGVADDHDGHLQQGADVQLAQVEPDEHRDTDHAEQQAQDADRVETVCCAHGACQHDTDQRHCGDEQPGQRAGQLPLGIGQQQLRDGDLDHGEGQQWAPPAQDRPETTASQGQREQHQPADSATEEDQRARFDVAHGYPDEQVRIPQIAHIAANSAQLRRVIALPSVSPDRATSAPLAGPRVARSDCPPPPMARILPS